MDEISRSAKLVTALLKNVPGLMNLASADATVLDKITDEVTKGLPPPAFVGDKLIYRVVVFALAGVALLSVVGAVVLTFYRLEVPDMVTALGSAAIGAMAGLLVPSPTAKT